MWLWESHFETASANGRVYPRRKSHCDMMTTILLLGSSKTCGHCSDGMLAATAVMACWSCTAANVEGSTLLKSSLCYLSLVSLKCKCFRGLFDLRLRFAKGHMCVRTSRVRLVGFV